MIMNSIKLVKYSSNIFQKCLNRHEIRIQSKCLTTFGSKQLKANALPKSVQNLVIDLSFEDLMTSSECHRLARDLYAIHCINSSVEYNEYQFNVNVCNQLYKNSLTIEYLRQYLPQLQTKTIDNFQIHNNSYLDLFESERLVYLSSDAKQVIEFDSNDIYIIGGIVEKKIFKGESNRLSYTKAKREGLRVGRFPIDHFISDRMKYGITLFLPQVFGILSDVKSTQCWESAVKRHLPVWKLKALDHQKFQTYQCQ